MPPAVSVVPICPNGPGQLVQKVHHFQNHGRFRTLRARHLAHWIPHGIGILPFNTRNDRQDAFPKF